MMKSFCVFCVALLFALLVGLPTVAFPTSTTDAADLNSLALADAGPQWRRTANGWERADLWATTLAAKRRQQQSRADAAPHPLLIATLQLAASLSALAAWPYRAGKDLGGSEVITEDESPRQED